MMDEPTTQGPPRYAKRRRTIVVVAALAAAAGALAAGVAAATTEVGVDGETAVIVIERATAIASSCRR